MALATFTDADEEAILDGLFAFIDRRVRPIQERVEHLLNDPRLLFDDEGRERTEINEARREARMASAEAGYYTLFAPAEFGGPALGNGFYVKCIEEIGRRYGPGEPREPIVTEAIANWFSGPGPIWLHASPDLRDEVLPGLLSGELHGSFGLSEANAGSDVFAMETAAIRDGDVWVINGGKQWTSWCAHADFLLVFAVTDFEARNRRAGGITCFYVPTDTPGYRLESTIRIFGDPGGREGIISFRNIRVPDTWRIGEVDDGIRMAFLTLTKTRLWQAARSVGEASWALDQALDYAKERRTFGQPLIEHQSIQNLLADMATDLYAARSMTHACASSADEGTDVRTTTAMVKYYATNAAARIFDAAIQVHGGIGITNELRLVDGWKTARISRITEGADQIMQRTIALQMAKHGSPRWR